MHDSYRRNHALIKNIKIFISSEGLIVHIDFCTRAGVIKAYSFITPRDAMKNKNID